MTDNISIETTLSKKLRIKRVKDKNQTKNDKVVKMKVIKSFEIFFSASLRDIFCSTVFHF